MTVRFLHPVRNLLPDAGVVLVCHGIMVPFPEMRIGYVAPARQAQVPLRQGQAPAADRTVTRQHQVAESDETLPKRHSVQNRIHIPSSKLYPRRPLPKNQQLIAPQQWMTCPLT